MIKVAFLLELTENWLGGINYFRNLLSAIVSNPNRQIEPMIFMGQGSNKDLLKGYPDIEIIESDLFTQGTFLHLMRRVDNKLFQDDKLLTRLMKKHSIDIISHIFDKQISNKVEVPILGWIADFQHKHLPQLFTEEEIKWRDNYFHTLAKRSSAVLVSSNDAKNDFSKFIPDYVKKVEVLQFVVAPPTSNVSLDIEKIQEMYGFKGKYMYIPNQFWAHKNHKVLLEALCILKKQNRRILVISSGHTSDSRDPQHFHMLEQYIKDNALQDSFRILGKIPYSHVVTLGQNCLSLINPSLFEGWSTTVEEAKSLGKKIILSDIPIHREQNPIGATYFNPHNALELSEVLWNVWQLDEDNALMRESAMKNFKIRQMDFANTYEAIVRKTLNAYYDKLN